MRALDLQPDSQPAFQGLGEAAVEDIVGRLAQPNATIQREELDRAFADAEQAYRLGGRNVKTALALAGLYHQFHRCAEMVEVLWDFSQSSGDTRTAFKAGCRSLFEMSQQCVEDYDQAMAGHRLLLDRFADKVTQIDLLDSYLHLYRLYDKKGQQEEWLAAIKVLEQAIGVSMPLAQRYFYSIRRAVRLRQVEPFKEAIATIDRFVEWAEQTPQQHPLKWYYVMDIQNSLATIYHEMDNLPAARQTLAHNEQRLAPYRAEWQAFLASTANANEETRLYVESIYQCMMDYDGSSQVIYEAPLIDAPLVELRAFIDQKYRKGIAWSTFNLAIGYLKLDEGETALRLFQTYRDYRIENGITRERGNFHMWMAGLILSVRQDREAALDHLRQAAADSDFVARGQLKQRFFNGGFDSVVEDEDYLAVVNTSVLHE